MIEKSSLNETLSQNGSSHAELEEDSNVPFEESLYFILSISTLWTLITIFGLIGNGLVIFIAIAYKKLNDITNCYIFNLAITDCLFILFCIPFTTYIFVENNWPFGEIFCKLNSFISHASVQSTCLTLTAMTIHRCRLIIKNKTMSQFSANIKKRQMQVLLITVTIWIISFALSSPDLLLYTVEPLSPDDTQILVCGISKSASNWSLFYVRISRFVSMGTSYLIPLLIIILSYARLLSHLNKTQNRLAKFSNNSNTQALLDSKETNGQKASITAAGGKADQRKSTKTRGSSKSEHKKKKVTTMVAVVTLNFGLCWFPTHLFIIIRGFVSSNDSYMMIFKLSAHTLSYLTPVINPCLYAFYNENFRTCLFDLWYKITCRPQNTPNARSLRSNSKPFIN